jgi:purine nucleoside permease
LHGPGLRAAGSLADIKLVPVAQSAQSSSSAVRNLPLVVNCFDDEAKSWADSIDVLSHNSLDYCRLPSVIEAPESYQLRLKVCLLSASLQHQDPHFFILQPSFSQYRQHFFVG